MKRGLHLLFLVKIMSSQNTYVLFHYWISIRYIRTMHNYYLQKRDHIVVHSHWSHSTAADVEMSVLSTDYIISF